MASQPPLILVDNVFDRINLYSQATLSWSTAIVGREGNFTADYRRERTYYQSAATALNQVFAQVDLGAGNSAVVDACWIDRGHNLWGKTVVLQGSPDNFVSTQTVSSVVPAQGTLGGDPTAGWCVTEEGALYWLISAVPGLTGPYRYFHAYIGEVWQPIVTGVILGKRVQLSSPAGYSSILDEDAGERNEVIEASRVPGYEGIDRMYSARKVELRLAYIGASEYDAAIRGLRRTLFDIGQPAVVCMNYGTHPERAWLYRYRGRDWSAPTKGVSRSVNIPLYEYCPLIR